MRRHLAMMTAATVLGPAFLTGAGSDVINSASDPRIPMILQVSQAIQNAA
jgi:hypothetical protein